MADLPETATYDAGVYQLETTDVALGGAAGNDNKSARNLANRTAYLKAHVDAMEVIVPQAEAEAGVATTLRGWTAERVRQAVYAVTGLMIVSDQKAAGTPGGDSTLTANQTRDLNTVDYNTIAGASLAAKQITLPAGTYKVIAHVTFFYENNAKTAFKNVTDGIFEIDGTNVDCAVTLVDPQGRTTGLSIITGVFTIAATKVFEVQSYCDAVVTDGLGKAYSVGTRPEVYTTVEIQKIG